MGRAMMKRREAHAMDLQSAADDFYESVKPELRRRIAEELCSARRVLDLGCGNCELDQYLANEHRKEVTGVDISNGSFPHVEQKPEASQGLFQCIKADASHLDFVRDAEKDAVVSVWALHEIKDVEGALREAWRVIRPGGKILILEFPRGSLAQRLWNEKYFSVSEVGGMLARAGFQKVRAKTIEEGQVIWATALRPIAGGDET